MPSTTVHFRTTFNARLDEEVDAKYHEVKGLGPPVGFLATMTILGATGAMLFLALNMRIDPGFFPSQLIFFLIVFAVFEWLLFRSYGTLVRDEIRRQFVAAGRGAGQTEIGLADDGIVIRTARDERRLYWSAVTSAVDGRGGFELTFGKFAYVKLFNRIFEKPGERGEWLRFIREHVPSADSMSTL